MKSFLNISVLILVTISTFSAPQNWQPLQLNWKYNYKLDSAAFITNTLWIDSAEVINGDSVFYLNRIVTHCDTCHAINLGGPNPCDSCYALKNQPQFLQRKMTKLSNGIFYFSDASRLMINSLAVLNDTWLFDSIANITAQIISVATDSVFGNIDSVKTILLSSGDTMKLSMNFGILKFPFAYSQNSYFNLAGIEGANVGEKVPGFWEIFDFNAGDMFEYLTCGVNTNLVINYSEIRKYTITNKIISGDTVTYGISGLSLYHETPLGGGPLTTLWNIINQPLQFINYHHSTDNLNSTYNLYNNELFTMDYFWGGQGNIPYNVSRHYLDSNNVFTKAYGRVLYTGFPNYPFCFAYPFPPEYDDFAYSINIDSTSDVINRIYNDFDSYRQIYSVGLGLVHWSFTTWEPVENTDLIAYRKGNDTIGVFTPDSLLVNVNSVQLLSELKVYPNPARDKIHIQFAFISSGKIFITDNSGRKILEKPFSDKEIEVNVSSIAAGLYFVSVQSTEGVFTGKIVVEKE